MKLILRAAALGLFVTLGVSACATDEYGNRLPMGDTEKGVLIGAGIGAAAGALIDKSAKGALVGAVGGGIAGGLVGKYMDDQKRDLQKVLRPEVEAGAITIDSLPDNQLRISMTGATAFDVDSDVVKAGFRPTLDKIAGVVNRYGKTQLVIVGHTDSTGSLQHNMALSERRARSVHDYLLARQVIPQRLASTGVGPNEPRASNDNEAGRALNRRVEVTVVPVVAKG